MLKEARGINYTSAYYIVYAKEEILQPKNTNKALRNFKISSEEGYMQDLYSSYLSDEMKKHIQNDNSQLYYDIENYKMSGYVTRVI